MDGIIGIICKSHLIQHGVTATDIQCGITAVTHTADLYIIDIHVRIKGFNLCTSAAECQPGKLGTATIHFSHTINSDFGWIITAAENDVFTSVGKILIIGAGIHHNLISIESIISRMLNCAEWICNTAVG